MAKTNLYIVVVKEPYTAARYAKKLFPNANITEHDASKLTRGYIPAKNEAICNNDLNTIHVYLSKWAIETLLIQDGIECILEDCIYSMSLHNKQRSGTITTKKINKHHVQWYQ